MDSDFTISSKDCYINQRTNPKAIRNQQETIKLINTCGGLFGNVLDIGERNLFTEILENLYEVKIFSTYGDLDLHLCIKDRSQVNGMFRFVHYNNVIEHQFNPLFTLLKIKQVLKPGGILILGTPIKPNWITPAKCHFHELDQYRFDKLIERAGFKVVDYVKFWYEIRPWSIRGFFGMFYTRQAVYILKKA
jgi:SAM-dependent methyltransferase